MKELVVHDNTPIKLQTPPDVRQEELVRRGGEEVAALVRSIRDLFGTGSVISSLADGERVLSRCDVIAEKLPRLAEDIEQLVRPAIGKEIRDGLDLMVESRGSQAKDDKKIYGRMLIEDVAAQQPTIGAFTAMCRRVRRTCKYRPEIAEVLDILADEEYKLRFELASARETLHAGSSRLAAAVADEKKRIEKRTKL